MIRYIDVDKFLKSMVAKFKCIPLVGVSKYIQGEECFEGEPLDALINEAPTAAVAEVVRCKDCKYWHLFKANPGLGDCENADNGLFEFTKPDDFCSYGKERQ